MLSASMCSSLGLFFFSCSFAEDLHLSLSENILLFQYMLLQFIDLKGDKINCFHLIFYTL